MGLHAVQIQIKEATKMATNQFVPLEQFTFVIAPPASRTDILCVNLYADGRFNLNGKLAEALRGKSVQISFTDDAKHLCLLERDSVNAVKFPKSGSRRLEQALQHLKSHKIPIPAKYEVHYCEEHKFWQGDLIENPTQERTQLGSNSKRKS
jgi:hypothetical protein